MIQPADKNRSVRGASRKQTRQRNSMRLPVGLIQRLLVVSMLAVSVALCWTYGSEVVSRVLSRPIAKVSIEGEFKFIEKAEIAEMLSGYINQEFVQLDLHGIKKNLELQPWISTVTLARRWPDQLYVRVEEQQPIARWGNKGFINQRGELVYVPMTDYLATLPQLSAEDGMAEQTMQTYLALNKLLRPLSLEIAALVCDEKRAWDMQLTNGLAVRLGRDELFAKVQRVLLVYKRDLSQRLQDVARVDARYHQGVAVAWKETAQTKTLQSKNNT